MVTPAPEARKRFDLLAAHPGPVARADLAGLFAALPPVDPEAMLGLWSGVGFRTGDLWGFLLRRRRLARWDGKRFHGPDRVDALIVRVLGLTFPAPLGSAVLREETFEGVASTAMVYRRLPITDHFRAVDAETLMGAMVIGGRVRTWFGLRRETGAG